MEIPVGASDRLSVRSRITEGIGYLGIVGATMMGYLIGNRILFGLFTPVSGQIKTWWGTLGITVYGRAIDSADTFLRTYTAEPLTVLSSLLGPITSFIQEITNAGNRYRLIINLTLLVILAVLPLLVSPHKTGKNHEVLFTLPILGGLLWHMAFYILTGYVHTREWYWVWEAVLVFFIISLFIIWLIDIFSSTRIIQKTKTLKYFGWGVVSVVLIGNLSALQINLVNDHSFTSDYFNVLHQLED
jgi:phosphoglycerol transferase MdoB-like AlkP superfamily enzyme